MDKISLSDCSYLACPDSADEIFKIDSGCAECLYEAGKIAVRDVLMSVIENELTANEKMIVMLKWFENRKTAYISKEVGITPECVRKALKRAEKKIYNSLKYIVLYNSVIGGKNELPENFSFRIIDAVSGKEIIS